jgi:hypothetical protein
MRILPRKLVNKLVVICLFSSFILLATEAKTQSNIEIGRKDQTSYSIYLDPSAPPSVKNAANELKNYLSKVGGFSTPIVVSTTPPKTPFISIGSTSASLSSGLSMDSISEDGFQIVTQNQNLFILGKDTPAGTLEKSGGTSTGTANGVYTFIEEYLGVRWLMPGDIGEEFRKVDNLKIPAINKTVNPPFTYRVLPYIGTNSQVKLWEKRLKLGASAKVDHTHSWIQTIPGSLFEQHPTWFPLLRGKRVKPKGNFYKLETTNPELVQAYADNVIKIFRQNPNRKSYSLSPSDGDYGWSQSSESMALQEVAPDGSVSRTKLVLKFYNDVAKIVRKEFPDRKLGGYIYQGYLYPPKEGIPKLESNLSLVFASSVSYGFQLYRPDVQLKWESLVRDWGESSKNDNRDLYYYDLPTVLNSAWTMKPEHTALVPTSPRILNLIFPKLLKYGFKGAYFYGSNDWAGSGSANYITARLLWNPKQNPSVLLKEYYAMAYGTQAAIEIEKINQLLELSYQKFYLANPQAGFIFKLNYFKEIYQPIYSQIQDHYSKAYAMNKTRKQQMRLELLGQEIAKMKNNIDSND